MEIKSDASALGVFRLDLASMCFDDGTHDRQTHSKSLFLGGKKCSKILARASFGIPQP